MAAAPNFPVFQKLFGAFLKSKADRDVKRLLPVVDQVKTHAETMREALTDQVYRAIRELFTWNEGQFAFSPDSKGLKLPSTIEVELDPQHVLLDVARLMDEENA